MKRFIEKNRIFFNRIAKLYSLDLFRKINKKIREKTINSVRINTNSKVLDVGFGSGELLAILNEEGKNLKLYGIDISEEMFKLAKQRLGKNANLSLQSIEEVNLKDNFFNYIFSIDAFHHYANQSKTIRNIYRLLTKNGELILVDLDFGKLGNWIFSRLEPGNTGMHSAQEFKEIFEYNGFSDIEQRKLGMFSLITKGKK